MARPKRLSHFSYTGPHRYFLTFCTRSRIHAFEDEYVVSSALVQFRGTAREERFAILAYCLMPDHVHLLVEGMTALSDFQRFVRRAKQRAGGAYARKKHSPLWQEGYYERVLRKDDDAVAIARYIVANPVRAGLVTTPEQYPFSGSDVWGMRGLLGSFQ